SPEGAGAAKSAKGAGPQPGGGPSLVMVQTSGGGASSAQLWSRRRSPPLRLSTVFTQILEPAAGCCPLMVAVPFTMPTAGASSKLCVVFLPAAMVTASCSGSFTNTPPPPTCTAVSDCSSTPEINRVERPSTRLNYSDGKITYAGYCAGEIMRATNWPTAPLAEGAAPL